MSRYVFTSFFLSFFSLESLDRPSKADGTIVPMGQGKPDIEHGSNESALPTTVDCGADSDLSDKRHSLVDQRDIVER